MMVMGSTEEMPGIESLLHERHAMGLDIYDEWWEGTYRLVTGPTPEHGRLIHRLGVFFDPLLAARGLHLSPPVNIGLDKQDCRVPDIGIFRPDTPRTSPAFLSTAELVVEILSRDEEPGAKLEFFHRWNVSEYLEIDPTAASTVRLLQRAEDGWKPVSVSEVLGFRIEPPYLVAEDGASLNLEDLDA